MITVESVGIVIFLAIFATWAYHNSRKANIETPSPPDLSPLVEEIQKLQTSKQPDDILNRIESLETRFERLHKDALRYLQQGAQRHKRASDLAGEFEEEEEVAPQIEMPVAVAPDDTTESDLAWAARQLQDNGQNAII